MEGRRLPSHEVAYARRERTTIAAAESEADLVWSMLPDASVREAWPTGKGVMAAVVYESSSGICPNGR
jgi:hypothetical protein